MPEGPELKASCDHLNKVLLNKRIINFFTSFTGRYASKPPEGHEEILKNLKDRGAPRVIEIGVKGKFMFWVLRFPQDDDIWSFWITYGMSGQWSFIEGKHAAYGIYFNESGNQTQTHKFMKFNDPRHFGTLKFVRGRKALEKKLSTIGPDMLSDPPSPEIFAQRILRKPERTICEALLDQASISGVGNYIKSEALYRAKITPLRSVKDITPYEYVLLRDSIVDVCKEAYEARGSTISTYKNVDDVPGTGQFAFRVYGREVDPLGNQVKHDTTPDGRTSWWVPDIQT